MHRFSHTLSSASVIGTNRVKSVQLDGATSCPSVSFLLVMWSLCSVCVVFIIWILLECFKCGNVQVTNCGTTHVTNLASLLTLSNSIATFCMRGVQSSNHLP
uniref:Uncharacterized protein n=1 Tax=Cacopsylla melanoneura TaxID=428564 RepID=A0A8D8UPS3_9HEMI